MTPVPTGTPGDTRPRRPRQSSRGAHPRKSFSNPRGAHPQRGPGARPQHDRVNRGAPPPQRVPHESYPPQQRASVLPSPAEDVVRIYPLGGIEEIGRNMTVVECESDIIIVDMGLQFPEEDLHGIDYIIPNIEGLKGKERNIRGVIITHGHYDHIGAIPHLAPKLGNPPIYGTGLSMGIIRKRQEEFKGMPPLRLNVITDKDVLQLGRMRVDVFQESHTFPDSVGFIISTPQGQIVHTGDFKFDLTAEGTAPANIAKLANVGASGKALVLLSDSTNAHLPGYQLSEVQIGKTLEEIIARAPGRLIIGTFSSMLTRIQQLIYSVERQGKKLAIEGFSMRTNVEIAHKLGYMKIKKGIIVSTEEILKMPDDKVVIVCTGAQGQDRAVLMRIANREHRLIRVQKNDTVVFSSSVIPGTERMVQRVQDLLSREGAEVVNYQMMDVHAGGHGKQEDLKFMLRLINPQYFMPIHGNYLNRKIHGKLAVEVGVAAEHVLLPPDNGQVIEFSKTGGKVTDMRVPTNYVFVDGLGAGDTDAVIMRDRQTIAADGILVVIATMDGKTGSLIKKPDIVSRGFLQLGEYPELLAGIEHKIHTIMHESPTGARTDDAYVKDKLRDQLGQFLFTKTARRPMIIPVIIEV